MITEGGGRRAVYTIVQSLIACFPYDIYLPSLQIGLGQNLKLPRVARLSCYVSVSHVAMLLTGFAPAGPKHTWAQYTLICTNSDIRLTSRILQLKLPSDRVTSESTQLETNITTKRCFARLQGYRTDEPNLAHAEDHACDTAAECKNRSNAGRELRRLIVDGGIVCCHRALVQEVVAEGDTLVDCEPIACVIVSQLRNYIIRRSAYQ
jgi:hypothetical protein